MNFETLIIYFISFFVICNVYITYKIITAVFYNRFQKSMQLLILWVIPLLGLLIVSYFLKDEMSNYTEVISSNTDTLNIPTRNFGGDNSISGDSA